MQQPTAATAALPAYATFLTIEAAAVALDVPPKVVNRWIVTGLRTAAGRVHLRAVKIGGRWKVNPEWVTEFVDATTKAALPKSATAHATDSSPAAPKPVRADTERARVDAVMARLRERGVF